MDELNATEASFQRPHVHATVGAEVSARTLSS
jgi:hypothetical protein